MKSIPIQADQKNQSSDIINSDDSKTLADLKSLLLGPEQHDLEEIQERLNDESVRAEDMAEVLADAFHLSNEHNRAELLDAIESPVINSIKKSVKRDPQPLAEVLFPVIGPAIRNAITDALRGLLQSVNQTLDQSFSLKALKWRWEAKRTGLPFSEIVFRHTLAYRVEQVFLIHSNDGLLIQQASSLEEQVRDADAVSAMLTAIQDFVRDAFTSGGEPQDLDSVSLGEHTIWILRGPNAYLACAIRGVPPNELRQHFAVVLEQIHRRYHNVLETFDGDQESAIVLQERLQTCLVSENRNSAKDNKGRVSPLLKFILAGLLVLIAWISYYHWKDNQKKAELHSKQEQLISGLRKLPGVILTEITYKNTQLIVQGLHDPLGGDIHGLIEASGLDKNQLRFVWRHYEDMSKTIALERAQQRLMPPDSVKLTLDNEGVLILSGSASEEWKNRASILALTVPGISRYDMSRLLSPDELLKREIHKRLIPAENLHINVQNGYLTLTGKMPLSWIKSLPEMLKDIPALLGIDSSSIIPLEQIKLSHAQRTIEATRILFNNAAQLEPPQTAKLDALITDFESLQENAVILMMKVSVSVIGSADAVGSPKLNQYFSRERARVVANYLVKKGISADLLRLEVRPLIGSANQVSPELRSAEFHVTLTPNKSGI